MRATKLSPRSVLIGAAVVLAAAAVLAYEVVATRPVREAVRTYTALIALGNRQDLSEAERLQAARALCSSRYLAATGVTLGPEGGVAGLPRTINKNFQAWREGSSVRICPTNRIGPVYQLVFEDGRWRFDGLAGMLGPRGAFVPAQDLPELEAP